MWLAWWAGFSQCLGKAKWDWNGDDLIRRLALFGSGAIISWEQLGLYNSRASPPIPCGAWKAHSLSLGEKGLFWWETSGPPREIHPDHIATIGLIAKTTLVQLSQLQGRCRTMEWVFWGIMFLTLIQLMMIRVAQNGMPQWKKWSVHQGNCSNRS